MASVAGAKRGSGGGRTDSGGGGSSSGGSKGRGGKSAARSGYSKPIGPKQPRAGTKAAKRAAGRAANAYLQRKRQEAVEKIPI